MTMFRRLASRYSSALLLVASCGGRVDGTTTAAGNPMSTTTVPSNDKPQPTPEPPTDPSSQLMSCEGTSTPVRLALPCKLGQALGGGTGVNVIECDLSGDKQGLLPMMFKTAMAAQQLNQPLDLSELMIPAPYGASPLNDPSLLSGVSGTVVFFQVDPEKRTFFGSLKGFKIDWKNDSGRQVDCNLVESPFWAVPGSFQ